MRSMHHTLTPLAAAALLSACSLPMQPTSGPAAPATPR